MKSVLLKYWERYLNSSTCFPSRQYFLYSIIPATPVKSIITTAAIVLLLLFLSSWVFAAITFIPNQASIPGDAYILNVHTDSVERVVFTCYKINNSRDYFLQSHLSSAADRAEQPRVQALFNQLNSHLASEQCAARIVYRPSDAGCASVKKYPADSFNRIRQWAQTITPDMQYIRIPIIKTGSYIVVAEYHNHVVEIPLTIADFALVVEQSPDMIYVIPYDKKTGSVLHDVSVTYIDQNDIRQAHCADGKPYFIIEHDIRRPCMLLAQKGSGVAFFTTPAGKLTEKEQSSVRLYSEILQSTVYQGDMVSYIGFVRSQTGNGFTVIHDTPVAVTVRALDGTIIMERVVQCDDAGMFQGALDSSSLSPGHYRVSFTCLNQTEEVSFSVCDNHTPAFSVSLEKCHSFYYANEVLHAQLSIMYLPQLPVPGGLITCRVFRRRAGATNSSYTMVYHHQRRFHNGHAQINLPLKKFIFSDHDTELMFVWYIRDNSNYEYLLYRSIPVYHHAITASLISDKEVYEINDEIELTTSFHSPASLQQVIPVDFFIYQRVYNDEGKYNDILMEQVYRTNYFGVQMPVVFQPDDLGIYYIRAEASLDHSRTIKVDKVVWVTKRSEDLGFVPDALTIIPNKTQYSEDDIARLLIVSPVKDVTAVISIHGRNVYDITTTYLDNYFETITYSIFDRYQPNVYITVSFIHDGVFYSTTKELSVPSPQRVLHISCSFPENPLPLSLQTSVTLHTVNYWQRETTAHIWATLNDTAIPRFYPRLPFSVVYPDQENRSGIWSSLYFYSGEKLTSYDTDDNNTQAILMPAAIIKRGLSGIWMKPFATNNVINTHCTTDEHGVSVFGIKTDLARRDYRYTVCGVGSDTKFGRRDTVYTTRVPLTVSIVAPYSVRPGDSFMITWIVHNAALLKKTIRATMLLDDNEVYETMGKRFILSPEKNKTFVRNKTAPDTAFINLSVTAHSDEYSDSLNHTISVIPADLPETSSNIQWRLSSDENNITMKKIFYKLVPKVIDEDIICGVRRTKRFTAGEEVLIMLDVHIPQYTDEVLITDYFPAGCIPIQQDDRYFIQDDRYRKMTKNISDGSVRFSLQSIQPGTYRLMYLVRSLYPGEYYIPPTIIQNSGEGWWMPLNKSGTIIIH